MRGRRELKRDGLTSVPEERAPFVSPRTPGSTLDVIDFRITRERLFHRHLLPPAFLPKTKVHPHTQPPPSDNRHTDGHRGNIVLRSIPFSLRSFVCSRSFSQVTVLLLVASRQLQLHQYEYQYSHMDTKTPPFFFEMKGCEGRKKYKGERVESYDTDTSRRAVNCQLIGYGGYPMARKRLTRRVRWSNSAVSTVQQHH